MKVALVHDWLNGMRGGERCLDVLCEIYPEAPIYTLFYEKGKLPRSIACHDIRTTWINRLPAVYSRYRNYLPFFPAAIESLDLGAFDLVISTSHCVAKGAKKGKEAFHICYCFTPMRYAWGFFDEYFGNKNFVLRALIRTAVKKLQTWDKKATDRVDRFVAISHHVRHRIKKYYDREAEVIYPPCETDFYTLNPAVARENFYLVVSALVPYKKIELAIEAFAGGSRRLVIIGDGPERKKLESMSSDNVQFLGWKPDEALRDYYRRARGLIFPGEEDFGIVPLEAQACGCPVIAYGVGGALETILEEKTGTFFTELSVKGLLDSIENFEKKEWGAQDARHNALRFSRTRFKDEMKNYIQGVLPKKMEAR